MKKIFSTFVMSIFCLAAVTVSAQSLDELKAMKDSKQAVIDGVAAEIAALQTQIDTYPGWKIGGVGVAGFNALANNNWYALGTPNAANQGLSLGIGAFANQDQPKYFWRNLLDVNLARSAAFTDKNDDATKTVALTNGLNLSSLFGYKLTEKLALSVEGRYTTSLIEFDPKDVIDPFDDEYRFALNSPGQATISAGLTWTPITNLVVLVHPLGYQKNWPGDFISSPGAKIGAAYAGNIVPGVAWTSNLTAFVPYGGAGDVIHKSVAGTDLGTVNYSTGELVNWEWINGFSTSLWKGVGLAFNVGLKGNKQQADQGQLRLAETSAVPFIANTTENPLQSYYTLGLSYTF